MRMVRKTTPLGHSAGRNSSPKVGEVPFRAEGYEQNGSAKKFVFSFTSAHSPTSSSVVQYHRE